MKIIILLFVLILHSPGCDWLKKGKDGMDGQTGIAGLVGPSGIPGLTGDKGDAGGDKGDKGDKGADGKAGRPGKNGSPGSPGVSEDQLVDIWKRQNMFSSYCAQSNKVPDFSNDDSDESVTFKCVNP